MIRIFRKYLKEYRLLILAVLPLTFAQIAVQMFGVVKEMKNILDYGVNVRNMDYVKSAGVRMIIFTLCAAGCTVLIAKIVAKVSAGFMYKLCLDCFCTVNRLGLKTVDSIGRSKLLNITTNDTRDLQFIVAYLLRNVTMVPIVIVCMLIAVFQINVLFFYIVSAAFALTICTAVYLIYRAKVPYQKYQKILDRLNLLSYEKAAGVRVIRAFCTQKAEQDKMEDAFQDASDAAFRSARPLKYSTAFNLLIMNWVIVLLYWVGSWQLRMKLATISGIILALQYLNYFLMSLSFVGYLMNLLPRGIVEAERVNELLDAAPAGAWDAKAAAQTDETPKPGVSGEKGAILLDGVRFGYSGERDVISGISLKILPGSVTAITGATGSGKSTLLKLICGLYQPDEGKVIHPAGMRFSFSPQEPVFFEDSIRNNLTVYHDGISQERLQKACDAACFTEVLERIGRGDGMEYRLARGGMNLSGGQKKRLSLARVCAHQADVYLLDEPYTGLDAPTEKRVKQKTLEMLSGDTVMIVSQRVRSICDADQIIVLDGGGVAGVGTHEELLCTCSLYKELYASQINTDEE